VEELSRWHNKRLLPKFEETHEEEAKIDELTRHVTTVGKRRQA
jgi:hypothetical protein